MSEDQLKLAVRTLHQLRDTLAAISTYGPSMPGAAVSSLAGLATTAADQILDQLGEPS